MPSVEAYNTRICSTRQNLLEFKNEYNFQMNSIKVALNQNLRIFIIVSEVLNRTYNET